MIRMTLAFMKFVVFAGIVMVTSQIPVGSQRICDHVRDIVQHGVVQRPIHWVASRFNFVEGTARKAGTGAAQDTRDAGSEVTESDRDRLSGLLKRIRN